MRTIIVEYGCGNPASIRNMLKKIGHAADVSGDPEAVAKADRLILPGVGHFDEAALRLRANGLADALDVRVRAGAPILGICVGMQLLGRGSTEGNQKGLGWIAGDCVRFDAARMAPSGKIPHMGWTELNIANDRGLFSGVPQPARFYFVHAYHMVCDSADAVAATAHHGYDFAAAIVRGNIAGVQFHPEKSHQFGMALLANFMRWQPA